MKSTIHIGDCRDVLTGMPDASVHAVVTDPPYGLGFMGVAWDTMRGGEPRPDTAFDHVGGNHNATSAPDAARTRRVESARFGDWCATWLPEVFRVLRPGGHLVAFGSTRTHHRLVCAIEDAGFEIRDTLMYLYGSGFPKSLDVSKAIDKAAGAEREIVGSKLGLPGYHTSSHDGGEAFGAGLSSSTTETRIRSAEITAPATQAASEWYGWGTALKPACEPICLARKPLGERNVAANVLKWGTGAINIDGCRIESGNEYKDNTVTQGMNTARTSYEHRHERRTFVPSNSGRWPANVLLDEEAADLLNEQAGERTSRFFFTAKPSVEERESGLSHVKPRTRNRVNSGGLENDPKWGPTTRRNVHPTVKPFSLMSWLVRLVTPPSGTVLDPFLGSGTTGMAAVAEGFDFIGVEQDAHFAEIAEGRIRNVAPLLLEMTIAEAAGQTVQRRERGDQ